MKTTPICILLIITMNLYVLCDDNSIPKEAQDILDKMNQDISNINKKIADVKNKAADSLEKVQKDQMKKGNLKSANAIQEEIDSIRNDTAEFSNGDKFVKLVGKWNIVYNNGTVRQIVIDSNGNVEVANTQGSPLKYKPDSVIAFGPSLFFNF